MLLYIFPLLRKNEISSVVDVCNNIESFLHILNTTNKTWLAVSRHALLCLMSARRRKCRRVGVQKEITIDTLHHISALYRQCDIHNKPSCFTKTSCP